MKKRKPILLIDDNKESIQIKNMLFLRNIDFIEYNIKKFGGNCCGHLPTTSTPSIFAPEGVYREKDEIEQYITKLILYPYNRENG